MTSRELILTIWFQRRKMPHTVARRGIQTARSKIILLRKEDVEGLIRLVIYTREGRNARR
jgi:hypothetical protein